MKKTFDNLLQRSSVEKALDKRAFLLLFSLPGMLGERLFAAFDRNNREQIDFKDFVDGLGMTARGTDEEKIEFLFRMYDSSNSGSIQLSELKTMLYSSVFASHTILENSALVSSTKELDLDDTKMQSKLQERVHELIHSALDQISKEPGIKKLKASFSSDSIGEKHSDCVMDVETFKKWVLKNPEMIELLESVFSANISLESTNGSSSPGGDDVGSLPRIGFRRRKHSGGRFSDASSPSRSETPRQFINDILTISPERVGVRPGRGHTILLRERSATVRHQPVCFLAVTNVFTRIET